MKKLRIPIRLKIMVVLLFGITTVVSLITFSMANFFHTDKRSYVRDWVSIAALTTAEECQSLLDGYAQRLQSYARVLASPSLPEQEREAMARGFFADFPELVDLRIYEDATEIYTATDHAMLEAAGLTVDGLAADREANPLPMERILQGDVHLYNSTLAEDLPTFTLAFSPRFEEEDAAATPQVLAAVVRLDGLLRLGAKFKVLEIVLADAQGTLLAHPDLTGVVKRRPANLSPEAALAHDENRAGMTIEISRGDQDIIGGFAGVPFGKVTVAAHIPTAAAFLASRALLNRLLWVSFILLVAFAVGGRLWARRITRPVERLSAATRTVARGEFDVAVDVDTRDEIGELAGSFNQMASELKTRDEELATAHSQLIQSEKMAAFGQLGAGIAHEVKNPLTGIYGCAQLALMELDDGTPMHKNLSIIEKETKRCKTIIDNLLKFARHEKALLEPTQVNEVLMETAMLMNHQLEINEVSLGVELAEELPMVQANGNQLQQVLMNLMMNAQQAMEGDSGTVTLRSRVDDEGHVEILVEDDGPGMPEDVRTKIFEPFFTTKPTGKGTGLGLSVSFGIIEDHRGQISVDSEIGSGTTFSIRLPTIVLPEQASGESAR